MKDKRRFFTDSQKNELYMIQDGLCGICKRPLGDDWEADHKIPWVLGGKTIIKNGQATCKNCNRKKGTKIMQVPRRWQASFLVDYFSSLKKEYLLVATPGSGKTSAALYVAKRLLDENVIKQIIVVCPTESLKYQWAKKANRDFRLNLFPKWKSKGIKSDYDGICITYHKVGYDNKFLDYICSKEATLVILDEIHHSGEHRVWGESIKQAFVNTDYILGLSGTPFRGDNRKIPFVTYNQGEAVPDFNYGYGDAIFDKPPICRKVMFPALDGKAEFWYGEDQISWESFNDTTSDEDESRLLYALLREVKGNYLRGIIREADQKLDQFRQSESDSGGLVVAMNIEHASKVAKLVEEITGIYPVLVTSDHSDSLEKIENFANSSDKWIVAVKMVSEGVDIPRLRVGVYATNIITELYFRQLVGRFVRRTNEYDEWSVIYVPAAPRLIEFMERIRAEILHIIENEDQIPWQTIENGNEKGKESSLFVSLGTGRVPENDLVISEDQAYSYIDTIKIQAELKSYGIEVNEWQAGKVLQVTLERAQKLFPVLSSESTQEMAKEEVWEREDRLRKICSKKASSITYTIKTDSYYKNIDFSSIIQRIHGIWKNKPGNHSQNEASINELERKLKWLNTEAKEEVIRVLR